MEGHDVLGMPIKVVRSSQATALGRLCLLPLRWALSGYSWGTKGYEQLAGISTAARAQRTL